MTLLGIDFQALEGLLLLVFTVCILIQLFYFWGFYARLAFYKVPDSEQSYFQPVSIVISAKNEYINLKNNLPVILEQEYPEFEVVLVNDASDDETIFLLEDLARQYPHLKVVSIQQDLNFFKGKKFPLALGIKSAKYEHLLLTDADCLPQSKEWINIMVSGFAGGKSIVLGYGKQREKKGWINKVIRYETAFTAIQYLSLALGGIPYMGVGRNLAYHKSLFYKAKGFISHYKVSSGDDDLFVNQMAENKNTAISIHPKSFTVSEAKNNFKEWWRQKRRHLSTGKYYKRKHKLVLGAYTASLIVMLVAFVGLLILNFKIYFILILLAVRYLSQLFIFKKSFNKLDEKKLLVISPVIELFLTLIYPLIVGINLVFKQSRWK